ncbi:MAG: hypothetical protein K2I20_04110 [Clostridia bacterium]|nr:hypothetical protein [Clostridia bacterium]
MDNEQDNLAPSESAEEPPKEETQPSSKKQQKKKKPKKKHKYEWLVWGVSVLFLSFALTILFSFLTEISISEDSPAYVCVIVLLVLLLLNIGCDLLANAIISSSPEAYHAMASNKIRGAKRAVTLCRNATKLSSIFADVIGDICGIVSGAAGAVLGVIIAGNGDATIKLISAIGVSAVIGALTVGGKAIFKHFAIKYNKQIVFGFAKFTTFFKKEK